MTTDLYELIEENRVLRNEVVFLNQFITEILRTLVEVEIGLERLVNDSSIDNSNRRTNLVVLRSKERSIDAG